MSLRLRTLLTLILILGVSLVLMMFVMHRYIFSAFNSLEHLHFNRLGEHFVQTIGSQEEYFTSFVRDWGVWNDSYQFIQDQNQGYIDDNFNDETLTGIGTLCILYFDLDFNLVYAFSFAEDRKIALSVAESVKHSRKHIQALNLEVKSSFYLCVKQLNGPLLTAMYPVYPTDRSRPANGYILMGRAINSQYCYDVSSHSGFDFELVKVCDKTATAQKNEKKTSLTYSFISEDFAELTLMVRNVDHQQAFALKTKVFREMNNHLRQVFKVTVTVMVMLGVIGILLVELLLNHLVLSPISAQINHFNRIGESGDLSERFEDHSSRELHQLSQTANHMLDRIESLNKELQLASMTDSLTGVGNRRQFDEHLQHEWLIARRNGTVVSLLMIDIDHFKLYNDTYGHQDGDQCLQSVAEVISNQVKREADLVARYGGEEFAVILPDVPLIGAQKVAERIRLAINDLGIPNVDALKTPWITVSIGYASMSPQSGQDCEELIRFADQALYRAKRAGRNCIQGSVF
ncbi:diguanylate cyclase [Desulfuromonas acetoxidans]|uniref:sensor domain-containing diguanylate cyclase n=1 Tax=Desulfuromonas acetoxidans TaxID=891 RepID=UPI0029310827|nr:diguanylate cyclase [Desulfuromonas acetoxidans]